MFCGLGGFRKGLEACNDEQENKDISGIKEGEIQDRNGGHSADPSSKDVRGGKQHPLYRFVWANDNDKYACQVYRKNYGNKELYEGDIHTVDASSIPDFDLLTAGVPCQAWSIAGKRGGFEDVRGTLWFEVFRVLKAKQPPFFLLENVKGLLSHNKGRSFEVIMEGLCECGYVVDFTELNAKYFGVPQNRQRIYILGIRNDVINKKLII